MKKEKLLKNSIGNYYYQFLFQGGGFNSVWAANKSNAIKLAKEKFPSMKVQENTFVKATESMRKSQDLAGWMMFN
jgi:hypothetical protein